MGQNAEAALENALAQNESALRGFGSLPELSCLKQEQQTSIRQGRTQFLGEMRLHGC